MKLKPRLVVSLIAGLIAIALAIVWVDVYWHEYYPRNFYVVKKGELYRGARQKDRMFGKILEEEHCRTVVTLTGSNRDQKALAGAHSVDYVVYDWGGNGVGPFEEYEEVGKMLADPARAPVFYHCAGGRHRTNAATFAWLLETGSSPEAAFESLRQYGFKPDEHGRLMTHLEEYATWRSEMLAKEKAAAKPNSDE